VIRLDAVATESQNQRGVRTILFAAAALTVLIGCQSAVDKKHPESEGQSGDVANCARIREVPGGCGKHSDFANVYVDNMHKDQAVRATVRKHSPEGDNDTDYAVAEGGQLFIGCAGGGTTFTVVGCEMLKGETEAKEQ
jgi:hypothetical protein